MASHYNRAQAIKYLKKAFNSIKPDEEIELEPDQLFFASIANSIIYLADEVSKLNKTGIVEYHDEDGEDINGGESPRGRVAQ